MSESDVYIRQILTYKNGPRAESVKSSWEFIHGLITYVTLDLSQP